MKNTDTLLGCDLKSLKHKFILTNTLPLSAKILERHTHFGAQPHSVQSLVSYLHEHGRISGNPIGGESLTSAELEFFGEELRVQLSDRNYFKEAFELSGLRAKVFDCINELRLAGYTSETLNSEGIENAEKIRSLQEIFSLYEKHLSDRKIHDYPLILTEVIGLLQTGKLDALLSNIEIIMPLPLELQGMETTLLEVLEEKTRIFSPENRTQAFLVETSPSSQNLSAFKESIQAYLSKIPLSKAAKFIEMDVSFKLRACLTAEESLSEAFHWLSERGANVGDSAIVTPDYDSYAGPAYRFCRRNGIRLNLSHGLLASEFSFFADDMGALEAEFNRLKRKSSTQDFLRKAKNHFRRNNSDHTAYEAFRTQALGFIHNYETAQKEFKTVQVSENHAWELLRAHLSSLRISLSDLELDRQGIFLGRPQDLIGSQISHLVIVGLQDHIYPPKVIPDPILTDEERNGLNEHIEQAKLHHELHLAGPTELQKDLLEKLSLSVRESLFLAFESHDLGTGGRSLPSSFLNRVLSAFGLSMSTESLYEASGTIPESFFPRTSADNMLVNYDEHLARLGQVGPRFSKWKEILGRRNSGSKNQEDGATLARGSTDLLKVGYSASAVADFFTCPYKFYLGKIAKVKEVDTLPRGELQWLDHMQRGTYIHAVFDGWVKAFLKEKGSAKAWIRFLKEDAPALLDSIMTAAGTEFEEQKSGVPDVVIESELVEFREIANEFVCRELLDAESTGFYPIKSEEEFEGLVYSGVESASKNELTIIFKGIIDRVDTDGKGAYRVVDYKTGKNRYKDNLNLFRDSGDYVHFQHAIYGHWVRSQADLKASASNLSAGYYFTSEGGGWERVEAPFESFGKQFSSAMGVFHAALKDADFPKNAEACGNCNYRIICAGLPERRKNFAEASPRLEQIEACLAGEETQ